MSEPTSPINLPPTTEPGQPVENSATVAVGVAQTETVSPELSQELYDAFGPQKPQEADARPRDEQGRFLPSGPQPEAELAPETPPQMGPSIDPAWMQAAKDVYFTDEEIKTLAASPGLLQTAIQGRRIELTQRISGDLFSPSPQPQERQPQPGQTPTETEQALAELKLTLNEEEIAEELSGPLKQIAEHVNKLQGTLLAENQKMRQMLAQYEGVVQQSAQSAQTAQLAQVKQEWDSVAEAVPELVALAGKPSQAWDDPNGQGAFYWSMLGPPIKQALERYVSVVGPSRVDRAAMQKIVADVWRRSGLGRAADVKNNGALPGAVVRPVPRRAGGPESGPTGDEAYDRSFAAIASAWDSGGHNPFKD